MANKQIKFTVGNFREGYKSVEIFIKGDAVSYKILRSGLLNVDKKTAPAEVPATWLDKFNALNLFAWQENYSFETRGGERWELILKDGRRVHRVHGANAYPENWINFLDWLDTAVPELELVNRKRLEKVTLNYSRESAIGYTINEKLTLDRREKTLTLDKKNAYTFAKHTYFIESVTEKLFDAAQEFFDALEFNDLQKDYPAQIKIELVRHDSSTENFDALFNESSLPGLGKFVDVLKNFVTDLTAEIFAPIPVVIAPAQGKYIFCKVQFKGSYKHYTYQTDDETLAVGDEVDVPVGRNNDVNQARIVEIGYFDEYEAPFPIDKIKKIIGKHVATDWENY